MATSHAVLSTRGPRVFFLLNKEINLTFKPGFVSEFTVFRIINQLCASFSEMAPFSPYVLLVFFLSTHVYSSNDFVLLRGRMLDRDPILVRLYLIGDSEKLMHGNRKHFSNGPVGRFLLYIECTEKDLRGAPIFIHVCLNADLVRPFRILCRCPHRKLTYICMYSMFMTLIASSFDIQDGLDALCNALYLVVFIQGFLSSLFLLDYSH